MKGLLTALVVILSVGLGSPAFATGIFDRDELFFDREDLVEELILRDRLLLGRPFGLSPFGLSPFAISPFAFGGAGAFDLFLLNEAIEAREDLIEDLFEFDEFDIDDFDDFDFDDDDDDDD
jgi:hypothetical protein